MAGVGERNARRIHLSWPRWYIVTMSTTYVLHVGDRGRIVLPKDLRDELGLRQGDEIAVTVVEGKLTAQTSRAALARLRGLLGGTDVVDELLADRRREAARS